MLQINFFTREQELQITRYKEKWQQIALSCDPIDPELATVAVQDTYKVMGKRKPNVEICSSPLDAVHKINSRVPEAQTTKNTPINQMTLQKWAILAAKTLLVGNKVRKDQRNHPLNKLVVKLSSPGSTFLEQKINSLIPQDMSIEEKVESLYQTIQSNFQTTDRQVKLPDRNIFKPKVILDTLINNDLPYRATSQLYDDFWKQSDRKIESFLSQQDASWVFSTTPVYKNQSLACTASWLDFCFSTLKLSYSEKQWQAFQNIVRECGWIFTYDKVCYVCDRLNRLIFDDNNISYSETEAVIQFTDGFQIWNERNTTSGEA